MAHNKLILTKTSKELLKKTILEVYNSRTTCLITITFLKIYNLKNTLCMFPSVLSNVIHEYCNDELVFDMVAFFCEHVVIQFRNANVCLYNQSHIIGFEIYFYKMLYPNVHFSFTDFSKYSSVPNILKSKANLFMNKYLDKYMKTHYNIHDYFGKFYKHITYNVYDSNNKTTVFNHRVLKHIIIMSRILMNIGVNVLKKMK